MTVHLTPDPNRFEVRELLKMSSRGVVSHVVETSTRRDLTARNLQPKGATEIELLEGIEREARALKGLQHPGLVPFDKVVEGEGGTWMLFGFQPGMVLSQYRGAELNLPETWILWWLKGLLQAAHAMHTHATPLCLGYLEPGDVVVQGDRLVIVDLGVNERVYSERSLKLHTHAAFQAPELRLAAPPSVAADLFSVGALSFWLLTGLAPSIGTVHSASHMAAFLLQARPTLAPGVQQLIVDLLEFYPSKRPGTAAAALERLGPFVTTMTGQRPPDASLDSHHLLAAERTQLISEPPPAVQVDDSASPAPPTRPPVAPRRSLRPIVTGVSLATLMVGGWLGWYGHSPVPLDSHLAAALQPTAGQQPDALQVSGSQDVTLKLGTSSITFARYSTLTRPWHQGRIYHVGLIRGSAHVATGGDEIWVALPGSNLLRIDGISDIAIELPTHRVLCKVGSGRLEWPGGAQSFKGTTTLYLVGGSTHQ